MDPHLRDGALLLPYPGTPSLLGFLPHFIQFVSNVNCSGRPPVSMLTIQYRIPVSVQSLGLGRFLQDFFRARPTFKILTHVLIAYRPSENVNPVRAGFCFIHESISEYRRCLQGLSK